MSPFRNLNQEALLIALTEYYEKYRKVIETGASDDEFVTIQVTLEEILDELNWRRGIAKPFANIDEQNNLGSDAIETKAE